MSAVLSVVTPNAAYLLTDGASYDENGVLLSVGRKVMLAKNVPLAVTARGHATVGDFWKERLIKHADRYGVDMLLASLGDILAGLARNEDVRATMAGINQVEVIISAWSPTQGGVHRRFVTDGPGAFRAQTPDQMFYGGPIDADPTPYISPLREGETIEDWLRRGGVGMFEAFRQQHGRDRVTGEMMDYHAIGGQLDLTTVCADFWRVETIHRWPEDVIGERIDPFRRVEQVAA